MTVTVYEIKPKADKPIWRVTTMHDGIVNNENFECRDASPSARAETLAEANRYAREQRRKEIQ